VEGYGGNIGRGVINQMIVFIKLLPPKLEVVAQVSVFSGTPVFGIVRFGGIHNGRVFNEDLDIFQ
jgi:hypothetical protein